VAGVSVREIRKSFGLVKVLKGITLDIQDGEFMTLVGPSGCGKTTLLRIIAGLERQDSGNVLIGDTVVDQLRPSRRDLSMVFQSYALYPHLNTQDNIAVPLRMRHLNAFHRLPLVGRIVPGRRERD
jgi:multiple sugar transport system ATP-binding protein